MCQKAYCQPSLATGGWQVAEMAKGQRWGKRDEPKRDWKEYDKTIIHRGELLIPLHLAESWQKELASQNNGKVGAPFTYPDSYIECIGLWKTHCQICLRECQGVGNRLCETLSLPATPHYSSICRRLRRLGEVYYVKRKKSKSGKPIYAVMDGTGLKVCNRGEWMRYKHKGKRKGFVRITWAVDANTGKVLEFKATTEKTGENKKFLPILRKMCKNNNVGRVGGDGAFDAFDNHEELHKKGIKSSLKIKSNANTGPPGKNDPVLARHRESKKFHRWGYKKWAKKRHYGKRWMVETSIGGFKGMFGEYVYSKGMSHVKAEVGLKVHYFNQLHGF